MRRKLTPQQITVMANWPRLSAQPLRFKNYLNLRGWYLDDKDVSGTVHTLIKYGWLGYNWPKTGNGLKLNPKTMADDNIASEA
jgi:hypothetical protein